MSHVVERFVMASPAPIPSETTARPHVEIAHVLFIDLVGYSKLLINEQQQIQQELNQIVRGTEEFRTAESQGKLTRLPTGDGMALVFFSTPEAPVQCALQISAALRNHRSIQLRMGVHSGPISGTTDVNGRSNIAGAAINIAERIMSLGDAGHILVSQRVAEDLGQYAEWRPCLHNLGEVEVKHGARLTIFNLYTDELGNPSVPDKIKETIRAGHLSAAGESGRAPAETNFFEEVQRRKVYRVAAAYIIVAAGLIQLASAVFPAWELPSWSLRLVIVLLLIGFPIALILAWAFDVTPQGIRTTPPRSLIAPARQVRRNAIILVAIGVLMSLGAGLFVLPRASARKVDKSIAVLPFDNYSDDKENAFFADGIQDDILTNLAKIGDLKVISRTSVMGYRGKPSTVRDIGKALGVSTVLEGSVRKENNRVRVNVQLINAGNDQHIWAEEYDRDLTDMFALQTDLAQRIAKELQAKLSPSEKEQLTRKPTENGEAYLAFVEARDLRWHVEDIDKLKQAGKLYERALQLDPEFALASAGYSQLESWIFHNWSLPGSRDKARSLAQRALELQPDLPEAHLALGFSYYYGDSDFDAALNEFEIAQRGLPNEMEAYLALGAIKRRQGRWAESSADLEKAASLSPKDTWALQNLAFNYQMLRNFPKAEQTVDRGLSISPQSIGLWEVKSKLAWLERGDWSVAEHALQQLEKMPDTAEKEQYLWAGRGQIFLWQRKYSEALEAVKKWPDSYADIKPELMISKQLLIGSAYLGLGDEASARAAFTKSKELTQQKLASLPENAGLRLQLALALAFLGEKQSALAEANRAMKLQPESKDAFEGPSITQGAAQVSCIIGDHARAIELIDGLLSRPADLTVAVLKADPIWDPLRNEPAFQQLLAKHAEKS